MQIYIIQASLENTRSAVLNSTRRLKLDEVDELAARLGEIGREAVELKGREGMKNVSTIDKFPISIQWKSRLSKENLSRR
jgi:hypothetical protein